MLAHQSSAWVSDDRFAPFLTEKGGTHEDAVRLYEWHARLSGSCLHTLHHFEVLVRNAIDRQLGNAQPDTPVTGTWLLDPGLLSQGGILRVNEVLDRLSREGHLPDRRIHLWRNRLAHHDSLLSQRNDYRYVDMVQVATMIDPDAAEFLKRNSDMLTVLRARP